MHIQSFWWPIPGNGEQCLAKNQQTLCPEGKIRLMLSPTSTYGASLAQPWAWWGTGVGEGLGKGGSYHRRGEERAPCWEQLGQSFNPWSEGVLPVAVHKPRKGPVLCLQ